MILEKMIDNRACYTRVHVVKAMLLMENRCSREKLMSDLKLNEAPTKTLLNRLRKNKFVESTTKGHKLAKKGHDFLNFVRKNIYGPKDVGISRITMSKYNIAYLVKGRADKIKLGIEQRDQAIVFGADGMTSLVYKDKLLIPGMRWTVPKWMENIFTLEENDVILIGSAGDKVTADLAALNSAIALII
ncbi:MAG: DUF4443 domain-containing protein [Candidatus Aenigmatarchaeota archaeon]